MLNNRQSVGLERDEESALEEVDTLVMLKLRVLAERHAIHCNIVGIEMTGRIEVSAGASLLLKIQRTPDTIVILGEVILGDL
ncbi:MAG: hypothetical protein Kow00121_32390 [Elainellaceae cyanobacterium]